MAGSPEGRCCAGNVCAAPRATASVEAARAAAASAFAAFTTEPLAPSRSVGLAPDALRGNPLGSEDFVLERIHAGGRFVDAADERDRALQDWRHARPILNARLGVLVLHDEMGIGDVQ